MSDDVNTTLSQLNREKIIINIPGIVLMAALMVIGVPGNAVTCYIYRHRLPMTTTNFFIVALTVYDLLASTIAMPSYIVTLLYPLNFPSEIICKLLAYVWYISTGISGLTLLVIALHRYKMVCRPHGAQISIRRAKLISLVITGITVALMIPVLFIYGCKTTPTRIPTLYGKTCDIRKSNANQLPIFIYFGFLFFLVVSITVSMAVMYLLILRKMKRQVAKRNTKQVGSDLEEEDANTEHGSRILQTSRTNVTMLLVMIVFAVSYFPTCFVLMVRTFHNVEDSLNQAEEMFYRPIRSFYFFSNSMNPFIYGFRNKDYRDECRKMLLCRRPTFLENCASYSP